MSNSDQLASNAFSDENLILIQGEMDSNSSIKIYRN